MAISIDPIENGESGLSVREKLNTLIDGANHGLLGGVTQEDLDDLIDANAPATPLGLLMISTAFPPKLVLTWDFSPEEDFAYYDLQIRAGGGAWVGIQTSAETYEFTPQPATTYTARIRAVDKSGNRSAFSETVSHVAVTDTVPPATPIDFEVRGGVGVFGLSWSPNIEDDFYEYEIYESATTVAPTSGTVATYRTPAPALSINVGLDDTVTRYYWIRATDTSGNRSAWSARVDSTTESLDQLGQDIRDQINDVREYMANLRQKLDMLGAAAIEMAQRTVEGQSVAVRFRNAQAVALQEISASVSELDGELTAQAEALTGVLALVGNVSAEGLFRLSVEAGGGDVVARAVAQVRATVEDDWIDAGYLIEAGFTAGVPFSRFVINASQFVVTDGVNEAEPLVFEGGTLKINVGIIGTAIIEQLRSSNNKLIINGSGSAADISILA